ncbi:GerAB/ArcD/ProY family transporter [Caldalkalibacillus mannanilyticus]|uniref:GerAB/ArcD/ProY family transporter n=1 Tax=Caldalkalibacillus mannanilyticus TaxID=1418 RepID=UPI000687A869|nr:endospore germination permease [Caldalkalibacillus mannanilyticus]
MIENGKISPNQFTLLVTLSMIGSPILLLPSMLAIEAKQDAWITAILGVGMGLLVICLYNMVGRRMKNTTFIQYHQAVLGKWMGSLVSLLYLAYFFLISALDLRDIGEFMITHTLGETPIEAILILFTAIVVMGARLGMEVLARTAQIFFPWVLLMFSILVIFVLPEVSLDRAKPILDEGMLPVFRGAYQFVGFPFFEMVVFLMIFPYVNKAKQAGKAFLKGGLIGGTFLIIVTSLSILVLGEDISARSIFPSYLLAKRISIGDFIERIEAVVAGIWMITIFLKLTVLFYATALGLGQLCRLRIIGLFYSL